MDLSYFEKTHLKEIEDKEIKFDYDRSKPFIAPNELTIIGKEPLFKIVPTQSKLNEILLYRTIPIAKSMQWFGTADLVYYFSSTNGNTELQMVINSDKDPKLIWRIFIKIYMFIISMQSRSYKKQFIKYIENSA